MALTILASIKAAEEAAREKKRLASVTTREYLRETESAARREADEIVTKARADAKEKVVAAEKESAAKLKDLLVKRAAQSNLLVEKTRERVADVAEYIVGKVVG
jgi:vacuolar-type H+-ATPase subunit H